MNKNKAFDDAIWKSSRNPQVYVVFEKGLGDYGVVSEEDYLGEERLVVAKFFDGIRDLGDI